jgi:formylglycine-generating enzyme
MRERLACPALSGVAIVSFLALSACDSRSRTDPTDVVVVALPQVDRPAELRKNMVWIPPGSFVAGTPSDRTPRISDEEMPGTLVALHGFYIDLYPYPNEPGAIPTTNVSRVESAQHCEQDNKRLCSELEWERACKGPDSFTYEYGDKFRSETCGSGASGLLLASGSHVACRSPFNVFDMHGSVFEWTDSPWGRGDPRPFTSVRGGAGNPGDVVGRCANGLPRNPDVKRPDIGFRCCAGERNDAEVSLEISRRPNPLVPLLPNPELSRSLEALSPDAPAAGSSRAGPESFRIDRLWRWYPVGNEELLIGAGCSHVRFQAVCGLVIARVVNNKPSHIAFASSGFWVPIVKIDRDPKTLWLFGVDQKGNFNRRVAWLYGTVDVGEPERGERRARNRP